MRISVVLAFDKLDEPALATIKSVCSQDLADVEVLTIGIGQDGGKPPPRVADSANARHISLPENPGLSRARNVGVAAATGDYVFFPVPGNVLQPGALSALRSAAMQKDADVVVAGYCLDVAGEVRALGFGGKNCFPGDRLELRACDGEFGRADFPGFLDVLLTRDLLYPIDNKLYRRRLAREIPFDENVFAHLEDALFNVGVFTACEKAVSLDAIAVVADDFRANSLLLRYDDDRHFNTVKLWRAYEALLASLSCAAGSALWKNACRQLLFHVIELLANAKAALGFAGPDEVLLHIQSILQEPCFIAAAKGAGVYDEFVVSCMNFFRETANGLRKISFLVPDSRLTYFQHMSNAVDSLIKRNHPRYTLETGVLERSRRGDPRLPLFPGGGICERL